MMDNFPEFMKRPINAVRSDQQSSGTEGFIFDGADGSQVIVWQVPKGSKSDFHTHDFDEYFVILQGQYTGKIGNEIVTLQNGDECYIPAGTPHNGEYSIGFRSIHAFSAKRADRNS